MKYESMWWGIEEIAGTIRMILFRKCLTPRHMEKSINHQFSMSNREQENRRRAIATAGRSLPVQPRRFDVGAIEGPCTRARLSRETVSAYNVTR
eukprot:scaffold34628_cov166-Amphora_coffeaeformis.AAC.3